MEVKNMLR